MRKIYLFIILSAFASFSSIAQWNSAASMNEVRAEHVSANLDGGKVLVAGGWNYSTNLLSAEIYDPDLDSWMPAASMKSAHSTAAAVTLKNGKVLVIGGYTGSFNTTTCEIYDPVADTWTNAASLSVGRSYHTATLLNDGNVLVVGGYTGLVNTPVCELFIPDSNKWRSAGSLALGRSYHTATLLNDGRVMVTGGYNPTTTFQLKETEIYNPVTNIWSAGPSMSQIRDYHAASKLKDGRVMVTGGRNFVGGTVGYDGLTSVEIYNPSTNSWSNGTPLSTGLCYHQQFTLASGDILVVAGLQQYNVSTGNSTKGTTMVFNLTTNTWSDDPMIADGRFEFSVILLADTRVLVTGGKDQSAELYGSPSSVNVLSADKSSVVIYPNPSGKKFFIKSNTDGQRTVFVYDLIGNKVLSSSLEIINGKAVLPVEHLKSGIYIVKIEGSENIILQRVIIEN